MITTHPGPSVFDALSLAAQAADEIVVGTVRDTHTAIARRVHGLVRLGVGPAGRPAQALHLGIAGGVYAGIGLALRGASTACDRAAGVGLGPRLEADPRGRLLSAAVNGLIGDELLRERPQLAIPMAVRHEGRDVDVHDPAAVAGAFPAATGRVVVLLHGLCEDESAWRIHRERVGTTYADGLAERGWTPVLLRANTGLAVRENGVALASLLQRLVDAWPVPVERIALIGHSMGGLIMRAAADLRAEPAGVTWPRLVTDVVTLSTPHLGSWFAVGADRASRASARLPEVAALGRIIDRQGAGIRDLIAGLAEDVAPLPHARYRLVSASLTRSPGNPVARMIGDLLVTPRSAAGRGTGGRELFPGAEVLHLAGTGHFGVLNHPEVHTALHRWLGGADRAE